MSRKRLLQFWQKELIRIAKKSVLFGMEMIQKKIQKIEIQNETNDNTNDDLLDQTFMNPSAGFTCNECNFVAQNKSGLKRHRK